MYLYPMDSRDLEEYTKIRMFLIDQRKLSGKSGAELGREAGKSEGFLHGLERQARDSPLVSTLQAWPQIFGYRIEFGFENFWLHAHSDQEMLTYYAMSRPWGAEHQWQRQWLTAALKQWRIKQGVDAEHLGDLMGISAGGVRDWEENAQDPVLKRVMLQARSLNTRLTMRLWRQDEWTFNL